MTVEVPATSVSRTIADMLTADIANQRFQAGSRLPAERVLARQLHASRGSVRAALRLLQAAGRVAAAPQSGWFVTDTRLSEPVNTLISFTEMTARRGLRARTSVLEHRVRAATYEEVVALSVSTADAVLDTTRLRLLDNTPVCVESSVIALTRIPGIADVDLTDESLYEQMSRLGSAPYRSTFTVEAAGASPTQAALLEIATGAPVLITDERCADRHGEVLLCARGVYRANAYRFHAELRRHGG